MLRNGEEGGGMKGENYCVKYSENLRWRTGGEKRERQLFKLVSSWEEGC